jgi:hypothetical protein
MLRLFLSTSPPAVMSTGLSSAAAMPMTAIAARAAAA